jgi:hypothetical protein
LPFHAEDGGRHIIADIEVSLTHRVNINMAVPPLLEMNPASTLKAQRISMLEAVRHVCAVRQRRGKRLPGRTEHGYSSRAGIPGIRSSPFRLERSDLARYLLPVKTNGIIVSPAMPMWGVRTICAVQPIATE